MIEARRRFLAPHPIGSRYISADDIRVNAIQRSLSDPPANNRVNAGRIRPYIEHNLVSFSAGSVDLALTNREFEFREPIVLWLCRSVFLRYFLLRSVPRPSTFGTSSPKAVARSI
jgi:hypothetical protein